MRTAHRTLSKPASLDHASIECGGFGLLQILAILEDTPFAAEGPGSSQFFHYLAEALRRSFADRVACIGDPAFEKVPQNFWTQRESAPCVDRLIQIAPRPA